MKITKTKKSIALKISKSVGAWPHNGKWAVQNRDGEILISGGQHVPVRRVDKEGWELDDPISSAGTFDLDDSWFQCIISRDEYFHLYPAQDADGWIEWEGGECPVGDDALVEIKTRDGEIQIGQAHYWNWSHERGSPVQDRQIIAYRLHKPEQSIEQMRSGVTEQNKHSHVDTHPTIEQLAAEYHSRQDYAERKQQEADDAKAEAEAKLAELVAAGRAVGLEVSVVVQEYPFRVGDTVRLIRRLGGDAKLGEVGAVVRVDSATDLVVNFPSQSRYLVDDTDVELVSKGANNA